MVRRLPWERKIFAAACRSSSSPGAFPRRASFQRFAELVLAESGAIFEATRFARPCEVGRQTITNYLAVLEATFVVHVERMSERRYGPPLVRFVGLGDLPALLSRVMPR
jgi:hypothetical protein